MRDTPRLSSRLAGLALVALGLVPRAGAQQNPVADRAKLLTPEAALNVRSISDLQFSPDGTRLAFVLVEPPKSSSRARHIWVYEKQSGAVRQFTYSAKSESSPRWSADGKQLAFLSNRAEEQQQIYLMRVSGAKELR
jgi:Tol biopolymer transport system component